MIARNRHSSGVLTAPAPAESHDDLADDDQHAVGRVRDSLAMTGYRVLQDIDVEFTRGTLALRGTVPSFYLKQLAQHAARDLPEVQEIQNQLQVQPAGAE